MHAQADGSQSRDPDNSPDGLSFHWACEWILSAPDNNTLPCFGTGTNVTYGGSVWMFNTSGARAILQALMCQGARVCERD